MSAAQVLEQARAAGVTLWSEGDVLRFHGPREALTDELRSLIREHKPALLEALAHPDPLPPLSPAAEARRQKVIDMLDGDGGQYAIHVEDPNTDPVIMALATPDGTGEINIAKDRYDPFAILEMVDRWNHDPDPLYWRAVITEPGGHTVEVDTPGGFTMGEWGAYAEAYHAPGAVMTPLAGLPGPQAPVPLDDALRAAVEGVEGITVEVFRSLLSPEDIKDIEAGGIHTKTLCAYAKSFAEGIRSGRVAP